VAVLDTHGRVAVHTGRSCVAAAGHAIGAQCSAQANMMAQERVLPCGEAPWRACSQHACPSACSCAGFQTTRVRHIKESGPPPVTLPGRGAWA
jgi:hypothetical protein